MHPCEFRHNPRLEAQGALVEAVHGAPRRAGKARRLLPVDARDGDFRKRLLDFSSAMLCGWRKEVVQRAVNGLVQPSMPTGGECEQPLIGPSFAVL